MMPEQAQIRRATLAAQRAIAGLDAAGRQELMRLYRDAADDLRRIIAAHAGGDDSVTLANLRRLLDQVEARLVVLREARDGVLNEGLAKAAGYGARVYEPPGATVQGVAAMRVSEDAVRFVRAFVADDGLQLSDRLWRIDRGAREAVTSAIERAVIQGHSAAQAAREFMARGQPVPADVAAKMAAPTAGRIGKEAVAALTGTGGAMDNAMRVFRTEINRAHGEAYMLGGEDKPYFGGWRFLLSPSHPEPDICDLLARQNLYGLGAGVYPSRAKCPWPAHPNTLSFVVLVFKDEVSDADRAGKETPLQALARLAPEVRRGVLGKAKSAAFDDGRLAAGMIRSPWREVQKRIAQARGRAAGWEWNEPKNARNIAKRGLDFADARHVMAGRTLTRLSPRTHADEQRWMTLGELNGEVLAVVYTERSGSTRVISFRKASRDEREFFRRK